MGLRDWVGGQFIDIIEWTEPSQNEILAYRFPRYKNEIKNGAKLIVREGQAAVFVKEGPARRREAAGHVHARHQEHARSSPPSSGWKYGFESPFKAEVYFISTRQWTDQKWGTQNPIMIRDPEFGPVRLRAFGTYAFKVTDPGTFLQGTRRHRPVVRGVRDHQPVPQHDRVAVRRRARHGEDPDARPGRQLREGRASSRSRRSRPELAKMGVTLTQFFVENISLPPEVEQALDKRTQMGVLGDLDQYTKFQTAEAIRDAAKNPGGMAGWGPGWGRAWRSAQQMGRGAPGRRRAG